MQVHIQSPDFLLVGFRSKIVAFMDRLTNYFSYDRPLGLIWYCSELKDMKPKKEKKVKEEV